MRDYDAHAWGGIELVFFYSVDHRDNTESKSNSEDLYVETQLKVMVL